MRKRDEIEPGRNHPQRTVVKRGKRERSDEGGDPESEKMIEG